MQVQDEAFTKARTLLREHFGYDSFHPGQESIIRHILEGRDVLGVMPTGAGKSVCYQIPALMLSGLTIIVSPLISLMKDQVDGLVRMGVSARLLNSSLSQQEAAGVYRALQNKDIKLLYIAPERLESDEFLSFIKTLGVSMVAVDEAHCVSQWGHDFRPSYTRIKTMIDSLPARPYVCAFTATATEKVRGDILSLLGLSSPFVLCTGFDRPNLYFAVHTPGDRDAYVLDYIKANAGQSGIVYCLTRKQVDKLSGALSNAGLSVLPYHAGLDAAARRHNQESFVSDRTDVIIATNAFGMGIDKSNVRFVLHCGMPRTLENYYQEAGRAGRDGEKSDCILLFSAQDIVTNRFLIEASGDSETMRDKSGEYKKLQQMIDYCHTTSCLRAHILGYFDEADIPRDCGNCLNCLDDAEKADVTTESQKIISCVKRMGNRYGAALTIQVLRGAETQKIRDLGFQSLSTYGIMRNESEKSVKDLISHLTAQGYLQVAGGEYPVLVAGERAMRFLRENEQMFMKRATPVREKKRSGPSVRVHGALFDTLRALRKSIAEEQSVPPYLIFSDASLAAMCSVLPRTKDEMLLVSGVGTFKLEQYGDIFLAAIKGYMDENGIEQSKNSGLVKEQTVSPVKSDTVLATYKLYTQGKKIPEIASARGITEQTVETHLIKAMQIGKEVDPEQFIPAEYKEAIHAEIARQGTERLRPIKDALPEEITYTAIRFAVAIYMQKLEESQAD